jgi:hypothetical protein
MGIEHYKKTGPNEVTVYEEETVIDVNDNDQIILKYKTSYGQKKIDAEMSKAQQELYDAQNFDETLYKQNLIQKAETNVYKLTQALKLFETETVKDKDGNDITVYTQEFIERFREANVGPEALRQAKQDLQNAQNFDETEYKQNLIQKAQNKIDRLNAIQAEMNKQSW